MGYFDKVAENSFKQIENALVYYPNGNFGKGRVIPDETTKNKLLNFQKSVYKSALFVVLPYSWMLGLIHHISLAGISPLLILGVAIFIRQYFLVKGLAVHNSKLAFSETAQRGSKILPNWYYWVLALLSIGLMIISVWLPLSSNKPISEFIYLSLAIFSMGLLGIGMAVKMYKLRNSKQA
jgi:magnesium-transporting ATPase (P-type)